MEFVQAGVPLSFEVTFDSPDLYVGMAIFDLSGVSPFLVAMVPMQNVYGNTYCGQFTPSAGKRYLINKAVYTDNTYTVFNQYYYQGSETVRADDIAGIVLNAMTSDYDEAGSVGEAILLGSGKVTIVNGLPLSAKVKTSPNILLGKIKAVPKVLGVANTEGEI